jgi:4,5-DOPA dioxygenase extradiol
MERVATRMPVGFVSHGAPTLALDAEKGADFAGWARSMPRPRAVLVLSAHWEDTPLRIGTVQPERLLHDFSGFGQSLYALEYRAPAAPELAERVARLLGGPRHEDARMWDHGVWVPLLHMYPHADVPVLQLSLPSRSETPDLFELGRRLAPLRDEGVLILASGGLVHNLTRIDWKEEHGPESWALDFEGWARSTLVDGNLDAIADLQNKAPHLRLAHPTLEHILPLVVAAGAASDGGEISFPIGGFEYGNLSRTAVQFGRSQS